MYNHLFSNYYFKCYRPISIFIYLLFSGIIYEIDVVSHLILWHPFRVSRRLDPGKTSGNGRRVVRGEVRENRRLPLAVLRASVTGVFLLKLLYI